MDASIVFFAAGFIGTAYFFAARAIAVYRSFFA